MGTRADFYVGRGPKATWLGSIAWDGYPEGDAYALGRATDRRDFRRRVAKLLAKRNDATLPDRGWPWPWEDSRTTDFAYTFDRGQVWISGFGRQWVSWKTWKKRKDDPDVDVFGDSKMADDALPNMKTCQNVRLDEGSGILIVRAPR